MLKVFVPGPLTNPMNGSHGFWAKRARWARQWRERTQLVILEAGPWDWPVPATVPKVVVFVAHTFNRVDDDALGPMLKPCRDALVDTGLIHSDGPTSGHRFTYAQVIDRKQRGVEIEVTTA